MWVGNPTIQPCATPPLRRAWRVSQSSTSTETGYLHGRRRVVCGGGQFRRRPRVRGGDGMGIGASIFLFAVGAVLTCAVSVPTSGVHLHTGGVSLMRGG